MTEKTKKLINYIVVFAVAIAIGFFAGRSTITPKTIETVKFVPGDTITIRKDSLVPVYVKAPVDTSNVILLAIKSGKFNDMFPPRKDSIIYVTKEDTAKVVEDWASLRLYDEMLFDIDTVGTEKVSLGIQYNRLQFIDGYFTPVTKHVNTIKETPKRFAPFIGAGITTAPEIVLNGGVFMDDKYGASVLYEYDWIIKKSNIGLLVLYKF